MIFVGIRAVVENRDWENRFWYLKPADLSLTLINYGVLVNLPHLTVAHLSHGYTDDGSCIHLIEV